MYSTIHEFSIAVLLDAVKIIIMMCGIFNFEIKDIKKEKKWPELSLCIFVGMTAVFYLIPVLLGIDISDEKQLELLKSERPAAAVTALVLSLNSMTMVLTAIVSVLPLIKGKKKIILTALSEISISVVDEIVHSLMCWLLGNEYMDLAGNHYLFTTSLTIIILALPAYIIQRKKKAGLAYPIRKMGIFYLVMLFLSQFYILIFAGELQGASGVDQRRITMVIVLILVVECAMIYTTNRRDYYYDLSHMNEKMLDVQEKYYMKLLSHQDEIRKFRHDLKNHMISVEALINEGRYDEVKEYFAEFKGNIADSNPEVKTGNTIVSAIASDYMSRYPQVELNWNGLFPDELNLSNTDLCTIFSNILGNAFENADKCEDDKKVSITVETMNNNMIMTAKNTVAEKAVVKNGVFVTSKDDKFNHGIGTQNIKKTVESNNGIVEYNFDEKFFEVKIILLNALKVF